MKPLWSGVLCCALMIVVQVCGRNYRHYRAPRRRALISPTIRYTEPALAQRASIGQESQCKSQPHDLVFIIDSSRSVRPQEFEKVKVFLIHMVDTLDIGPDQTRVAVINYASTVKMEFTLNTYTNKRDIKHAISQIEPLSTGTMTGLAIEGAMQKAFVDIAGARPKDLGISRVAVIVTDGRPQDQVSEIAGRARAAGIEIYAVGVDRADMQSLRLMASEPLDDHVFYVETYGVIKKLTFRLKESLCGVDMCAIGDHNCEQICVSTTSSYYCRCHPGFKLNEDRRTCSRVDNCAAGNHECEQICVNTTTGYYCKCHPGFTLNEDLKKCSRVNHCAAGNHDCEQICVNTTTGYYCSCHPGFILNEDQKTCSREDKCESGNHDCEQLCLPAGTDYYCSCYPGYQLNEDQKTCSREDMCAAGNHDCDQICVTTATGYACKCRPGFVLNEDQKTCSREDMCAAGNHDCDQICVSTATGYACKCRPGFVLNEDQKTCSREDMCASGNHDCEQICVTTATGYDCQCHPGFILNEDQKTCSREDMCATGNHDCEQICVTTATGFYCKCHPGFILNEDQKTCSRVDLCAIGNHDCEQICVSTGTGYYCKCHSGFMLNEDLKTCAKEAQGRITVKDPCQCEALLDFQRDVQSTFQKLSSKLDQVTKRIQRFERELGRY
ncbi:uncharacterized protein [Hemitrygon akajei]|uniref:uncharacterized protein n=1 Tax=Hemitrygon akajei TaxID=2704970 RepID=UPI003BF99259